MLDIRDMTPSVLVKNIKFRVEILTSLHIQQSAHKDMYAPHQ